MKLRQSTEGAVYADIIENETDPHAVTHEFGHMLGLDDAYGEGDRPSAANQMILENNRKGDQIC